MLLVTPEWKQIITNLFFLSQQQTNSKTWNCLSLSSNYYFRLSIKCRVITVFPRFLPLPGYTFLFKRFNFKNKKYWSNNVMPTLSPLSLIKTWQHNYLILSAKMLDGLRMSNTSNQLVHNNFCGMFKMLRNSSTINSNFRVNYEKKLQLLGVESSFWNSFSFCELSVTSKF